MSNYGSTGNLGGVPLPKQNNWQPKDQLGSSMAYNPAPVEGQNTNDPTGGKMTAAQGAQYGNIADQAQGMAAYFNQAAQQYNQQAPQISDVSQLSDLSAYYENALKGNGPSAAQSQLQSGIDQSVANQMAMAASTRGGAAAMAGAQRAAQQGAGSTIAGGAAQAAALRSQEMQAAAQGLQGVGTLEAQRLAQNAQLQQANQGQINAMQTALYGMGEQESGLDLSAQQAYMANLLAAEGINTQQSEFNTQLGVQLGGAALNASGQMIGAGLSSDEYAKEDVQPEGQGIAALPPPPASQYSHASTPKPLSMAEAMDQQNNASQVGTNAGVAGGMGALKGGISGGLGGALLGAALAAGQAGLSSASATHPGDQGLKTAQGVVDPGSLTQANTQKNPNDFGAKAANVGVNTAEGAGIGALGGSVAGPVGTAAGAIGGGIAGFVKGIMSDERIKRDVRPASMASLYAEGF